MRGVCVVWCVVYVVCGVWCVACLCDVWCVCGECCESEELQVWAELTFSNNVLALSVWFTCLKAHIVAELLKHRPRVQEIVSLVLGRIQLKIDTCHFLALH